MTGNAPNQRPVISLGLSPADLAVELAGAIAILVSILPIVQFWGVLPDRIPIHFGFRGLADAWGDKVMIWMLPAVAAIIFVVLTAVSPYPHTFNYPVRITQENARRQYLLGQSLLVWLKAEVCWLFAFVVRQQILVALGNAQRFSIELVFGIIFLIFATVGVYLVRAYLAR
ncbi:MAG: DUF1648 domain-containing protein [Microcoleus sp. PH2017_10_PVI_O_A]|uniref:DUF1648 domain-containing protein n=1 Tax=unclassified Microcoleus TaxID=2642155 RepID=UPI001D5AEC45|nr:MULTISPECIES: DUF1648 domain-containing protein [unclassified Microcoleus]TAE80173.1 MAG: DUF1648 domain-containing protein [Oscillatoriales cyanobacterium]MCC3404578.1 DUF1648 domain-containing protein [Microcoleus sp. PH2017_10_PVI_O_A]MCC3461905.1 DUF1648 domain-containing protein [Microcoleus sp. PH2017_11_PCY_U_A]MCC3480291.1 DUF1648 domain-containing protein [Microcoleus sp. PH2017_12_PCY_D_A]MCC3527036.1 DUF1648 domain-containing protein [Microcoleus sp. PH2017_21_RUC_O_A]